MRIIEDQVFEEVLTIKIFDVNNHVLIPCLIRKDHEDILLESNSGMRKFTPFLNHEVRIFGNVICRNDNERSLFVRKLCKVVDGVVKPLVLSV